MSETPNIFIGYDDRQHEAYEICRQSIIDHASGPVNIYPLDHRDLRQKGLFSREWLLDTDTGNLRDALDGMPFSNQFSHTRFLVPAYCSYLGLEEGYAMFVDPDFVFQDDVYILFEQFEDSGYKVGCVKHNYEPKNTLKMDNQKQTTYPKKLWSSLMMFDIFDTKTTLTQKYVNTALSSDLHRFNWIDEDSIYGLPEEWNAIPNHSEERCVYFAAIHFTEGLPTMPNKGTCKYSRIYLDYRKRINDGRI